MSARNTTNSMLGGRHSETFSPMLPSMAMGESNDVQPFLLDSSVKKHREPQDEHY